ncbi:hypothetical protein SLE2022_378730 [Rubroshorea leprosula]
MAMHLHFVAVLLVSIIGFISVLRSFIGFFNWVWFMFLRPPKNLRTYGSWAVVTGPTDGTGKALAFDLASEGLNLLLVGRDPSKLESTSEEIRRRCGDEIEIKTVVADLAKYTGEEISRKIGDAIGGLDIGILINNAGVAYPYERFLHEVDSELTQTVIQVNVEAVTWITRAVLPVMLKKKKGAIVNIGSGTADDIISFPLCAIYAATKAYLAMFSKSISLEYKKNEIDIQCQVPFYVATKMSRRRNSSLFVASPEGYSRASIKQIGYEPLCIPFWSHSVQWFVLRALSGKLLDYFIFKDFLDQRKKGLANDRIKDKVKQ